MKHTYRLALLAALGLATATGAQAQGSGDLLLGFNDLNGTQNDYVVNLGSLSQFTTSSYTVLSFSGSTFSTAYSADGNAMNDVAAGAVGGYTGGSNGSLFQTAPNGGLPAWNSSMAVAWLNAASEAQSPVVGEYSSAGPGNGNYGWSQMVAASPTVQGSAPGGNVAGNSANPLGYLTSGVITEQLYESTDSGVGSRGSTPSAFSDVGTLIINANNDTVTYFGTAVPEPSVYGLLAGCGLLAVALRRPMTVKKS